MSDVQPVAVEQSQPTPAAEEPLNPVQALIARLQREAEEPAPKPTEGAQSAATEGAKDAIEAATGEPAPEQKANESDAAYEIRLVKIQKELKAVRNEAESLRQDASRVPELKKQLAALEEKLKTSVPRGKKAFAQFVKEINEGKLALDDDDLDQLPEGVRAKLAKIDEWEAERKEAKGEATRKSDVGIVAKFLEDNADDYPLFGANVAGDLVDAFYSEYARTGAVPNLAKVVSAAHEAHANLLIAQLKGKKAKDFLVSKDGDLKAIFGMADERKPAAPASANKGNPGNEDGPRSLTNSMAQANSPHSGKRQTEAEERADILSQFAAWKRAQGG